MTQCTAPTSLCTGQNLRRVRIAGRPGIAVLCAGCLAVYRGAPFAFTVDVLPESGDRRSPQRPVDWRSRFGFRRRSDRVRERAALRLWRAT